MNKKLKAELIILTATVFMLAIIQNDTGFNNIHIKNVENIKLHAVGAANAIDLKETIVSDKKEKTYKSLETNELVFQVEEPKYEYTEPSYEQNETSVSSNQGTAGAGVLTASGGVNYNANGNKETYYNLDMGVVVSNAHNMGIEGEYWVRDDGVKMLGDYVMVAACYDVYPKGSLVETSLGTGVVVDTGGFASGNPYQLDIAVSW